MARERESLWQQTIRAIVPRPTLLHPSLMLVSLKAKAFRGAHDARLWEPGDPKARQALAELGAVSGGGLAALFGTTAFQGEVLAHLSLIAHLRRNAARERSRATRWKHGVPMHSGRRGRPKIFAIPPLAGNNGKARGRRQDKATLAILDLLRFVRWYTGRPHRTELALLLRDATGDRGVSANRLAVLEADSRRRQRSIVR